MAAGRPTFHMRSAVIDLIRPSLGQDPNLRPTQSVNLADQTVDVVEVRWWEQ